MVDFFYLSSHSLYVLGAWTFSGFILFGLSFFSLRSMKKNEKLAKEIKDKLPRRRKKRVQSGTQE